MGNSTNFFMGIFTYIDNRLYWLKKYEEFFSVIDFF
jgi:hypothetical protein